MKIALLGAESTGKSTLSNELAAHLRSLGRSVAVVPEVLREWCQREQRAPRPEEQLPIAQEQERRVDEAAAQAEVVIADTTALMVAIYGGMLFEDGPLLTFALERQRGYTLTLLTGLDLPWVPDRLQRVSANDREPVDALVRNLLARERIDYRVVYGSGPERLRNALAALPSGLMRASDTAAPQGERWVWRCDKCSDPECEHRLFRSLVQR